MSDLLAGLASWQTFVAGLVVFGLAPGVFLRAIILMYRPDDVIRDELLAELRVVPRWERPFWVAEQFETALFEGVLRRLRVALAYRRGYYAGMCQVRTEVMEKFGSGPFVVVKRGTEPVTLHVPSFTVCTSESIWRSSPRIGLGYLKLYWRVVRGDHPRKNRR